MIVQNRAEPVATPLRQALRRRMTRPQRHRLLQGYPMAPLLSPVPPGFDPFRGLDLDDTRPLLVGVLGDHYSGAFGSIGDAVSFLFLVSIPGFWLLWRYLPESVSRFPAPEAFGHLLQAHGFPHVEIVPLAMGIVYLYVARTAGERRPADARVV